MSKIAPKIIKDPRGWVFHEWRLPKGFKLRKTFAPWRKGKTGKEAQNWEVVDPSSSRGDSGWAVAPDFFDVLLKLATKPKKRKEICFICGNPRNAHESNHRFTRKPKK